MNEPPQASPPTAAPLVVIRDLAKAYPAPPGSGSAPGQGAAGRGKRIEVLTGVNLDIRAGEMLSLTGASGVGKSTFLHLLGTLDVPTAGSIRIDGEEVFRREAASLADYRNRFIGFVFQSHYLLPEFTALQNAAMPALVARQPRPAAEALAREALEAVGLGARLGHKPGELSGGEQQRVALARALVLKPKLLLADEPTGNLDPATGEGIHDLLFEMNRRLGITALVVTHNTDLAARLPRRLRLEGGQIHDLS